MSRTANSLRNIKINLITQLINNVLRFVARTVFIYVLGEEYLGISSLYTNILTLLSVSELGFSSAVTFSLYKPLAEDDKEKIRAIMTFYGKVYKIIGCVVLGLGLCLIPVLPVLMNGTTDKVNIYAYYLLYLAQSVASYFFFAHKQTLLLADQKKYLVDGAICITRLAVTIAQIITLLCFESFLIYTLLTIISEVAINLLISFVVDKRYPYLKEKGKPLAKEDIKSIMSRVSAMFLYRVCNIVGFATDNLIISSHISVLMVGLYDNYNMIINVIQNLLSNVMHAFTGSLGNLYVTESDEKNEQVFRCLNLVNLWFIIFTSVCCLVLFQPFITLWIGEKYTFDYLVVFIIVMNYATNHMQGVIQIYKDTTGLFVKGRYRPIATVVLNLGLSLIWVRTMGIAGVFLGSIVSRMSTTWFYDGWLIYRHAFHKSSISFYLDSIAAAVLIVVLTAAVQGLVIWTGVPVTWIGLILRGIICTIIVNPALLLWYGRREEFRIVKNTALGIIKKKLKK